jgi:hypothetical protein
MPMKRVRSVLSVPVLVASLAWAGPARADDFRNVELHGLGMLNNLQASHSTYDANHRGIWDDNFLGQGAAVTRNDGTKSGVQIKASSEDPTHFTWFFVDYSQLLGPADTIICQPYGGNTFTDDDLSPISQDRRLFGGSVTYRTPIDGLRFLCPPFHVRTRFHFDQTLLGENSGFPSLDYIHDGWDVKSEYGQQQLFGVSSDADYLQARYTFAFARRWMPFTHYDYATSDKALKSSNSYSQKDVAVGVNFKVRDKVSLSASKISSITATHYRSPRARCWQVTGRHPEACWSSA